MFCSDKLPQVLWLQLEMYGGIAQLLPLSSQAHLFCVSSFSYKNISVTGFRAHPKSRMISPQYPEELHLQQLYFPKAHPLIPESHELVSTALANVSSEKEESTLYYAQPLCSNDT